MMLIVLFGIFLIFLFMGMPVAYAMGISAAVTLVFDPALSGIIIPQKMFTAMDSFSLMAIPFFMLAGSLMESSGITNKLIGFARSLVGHFTGGLGHATIVTGVLMAGVSGSANADTVAIASVLVPALKDEGYDSAYSCAMVSGCGALGPIIPPSIMMVIYSGVTSIAIGALFMAGFLPGILIGLGYMLVNYFYARKNKIPRTKFVGWRQLGKSTLQALPALVMPAIIIGGILSGVVTATESGILACTYSIIYGVCCHNLNLKKFRDCVMGAVSATTNSMIIIAFAGLFGMLATNYNMSKVILSILSSFTSSPAVVLIFVSVVLFIAGMFIDSNAAMLMLIPIFAPLITQYGFNPLHFAMVCILTLDIGGLSPPVGLLIYLSSNITGTPLVRVAKEIWQFILINYLVTLLAIFFPIIVTLLPKLAGML